MVPIHMTPQGDARIARLRQPVVVQKEREGRDRQALDGAELGPETVAVHVQLSHVGIAAEEPVDLLEIDVLDHAVRQGRGAGAQGIEGLLVLAEPHVADETRVVPDDPLAAKLVELNKAWVEASSDEKRTEIWHQILEINADQVFSIGIVAGVPQPIVVNNALQNVPERGVYNWDPGAHFGIYRPDTFWFKKG